MEPTLQISRRYPESEYVVTAQQAGTRVNSGVRERPPDVDDHLAQAELPNRARYSTPGRGGAQIPGRARGRRRITGPGPRGALMCQHRRARIVAALSRSSDRVRGLGTAGA